MDHDDPGAYEDLDDGDGYGWQPVAHDEDVLVAYLNAESPADWLVNEVCTYLFDGVPADEMEDRLLGFDEVMQQERDRLFAGIPTPDEVVMTVVTVEQDNTDEFVSLRGCPSAALLLEMCSNMAEAGDAINVELTYGDGTRSATSLSWPFPMAQAIAATTPARGDLDDSLAALDPDGWAPPMQIEVDWGEDDPGAVSGVTALRLLLGGAFVAGTALGLLVARAGRRR